LVADSAVWAFFTLASAPYTDACAEATVAAGLVELPVEPLPPEPDPVEPPPPDDDVPEVVAAGAVVVFLVVVVVLVAGVVVVVVGVGVAAFVVVVVVVDGNVVVVVSTAAVVLGALLVSDTNWVVLGPALVLRLAVVAVALAVDVEPVVDAAVVSAVLSWSSAAVRFCSAWSRASCAEVGSRVARSWPLVTC
jgi:hypothetical protein